MLKIKAKSWNPKRFKELGRGGEAVVYQMKKDVVAKVFHKPTAMEYRDNPQLAEAAKVRIKEMQTKLLEFPKDLPLRLVSPTGVLIDDKSNVFGYVMPFIEGTSLDKFGRTSSILTPKRSMKLLTNLHDLVSEIHSKGMVIGDFNENNVIVARQQPHIIDADSMQFGKYQCKSFMPRFVAPELLFLSRVKPVARKRKKTATKAVNKPKRSTGKKKATANGSQTQFAMVAPHNELTDWYSFLVIAMRLITFTDPYGGVLKGMEMGERIANRITVFDQRVIYPMVARPLREVPRPILEVFFRTFHRGERFVPDKKIFEALSS